MVWEQFRPRVVLSILRRDPSISCAGSCGGVCCMCLEDLIVWFRVDVEQLIRDGQVEHVLNNDHQG